MRTFEPARRMFDNWKRTPLEKAIREWTTNPTDETRRDVCAEVARAQLYAGTVGPSEFLTGDGPHGRVLLVFTTNAELRRRSPTAQPVSLTARSVHALLSEHQFRGIVINPAGRWVFLSTDEVGSSPQRERPVPGQN